MKRVISTALIAVIMMSGLALTFTGCNNDPNALNVFNWGEFIDRDTIAQFTAETGIKVNYTNYATNEELYSKLRNSNVSYDIIVPSDYMIARMIEEDMLAELNLDNIPNLEYIDPYYFERSEDFDPGNRFSIPYKWGTVVLIYNNNHVTEPEDGWSWDILWDEQYKGKTIMFDNSRDAFGVSQFRLGHSINTQDERELRHAAEELQKQRELVQGYFMDEIYDKMIRREAWVAPYYSGTAAYLVGEHSHLSAAYPQEGTNFFIDSFCVPKNARNQEAAEKFINFMLRPEIAVLNAEETFYATPNWRAKELLDEEMSGDEISYPSREILENTEMFLHLSPETNLLLDSLWIEIRGAASDNVWLFPAIFGAVVVLIVVLIIAKNKKKRNSGQ
jgi:spermidine/putrescine transport system substrate-binding protein